MAEDGEGLYQVAAVAQVTGDGGGQSDGVVGPAVRGGVVDCRCQVGAFRVQPVQCGS
jgi:hypothetical protein